MKKQIRYNFSLTVFLIANVVVLLLFNFQGSSYTSFFTMLANEQISLTVGVFVLIYVLNWFLPTKIKELVSFWQIGDRSLESKVFSDIVEDKAVLGKIVKIHGNLPLESKEQSTLWNNIFHKNHEDVRVFEAHLGAYTARDMSFVAFLLIVMYLIGTPFTAIGKVSLGYIGFVIVQYLVTVIIAKKKSKYFVLKVVEVEAGE